MSTETRGSWLFSLRIKLLASWIPLMVICMLIAMVGLGRFLQDFFRHRAEFETAQLGGAIKSALRQTMLRTPDDGLKETLTDLEKIPEFRRVWIIDKNGRVAVIPVLIRESQLALVEEFSILMTEMDSETAQVVAERLRLVHQRSV